MRTVGVEQLQKELADAQRALSSLNGELAKISVVPGDPKSIQSAIMEMERSVDAKVGRYRSNPFVAPLVAATKKQLAESIRKAGQVRPGGGGL